MRLRLLLVGIVAGASAMQLIGFSLPDVAHTAMPTGNLLSNPSFESSSLAGWSSWQGSLSRVTRTSPDGQYVARIARSTGSAYSLDYDPAVSRTTAGTVYVTSAYAAAGSPSTVGKAIRLVVRERNDAGATVLQTGSGPMTLSTTFKRIAVAATVKASGDRIDVYMYQSAAASGDAFYADAVTLARNTPTADATAPSAPTGLTATTANGRVTLRWIASSDNVGVAGYNVWRRDATGTQWAQIARSSSPTYTDTTVIAGRSYTYNIRAYDGAGNVGGASPSVTISVSSSTPTPTPTSTPAPTPAPTPTPPPSNCSSSYLAWGPGNWPVACWKPYAATSVWNQRLPANPKPASNQAQILSTLHNTLAGGPDNTTSGPYSGSAPTFFARASDPLFRLQCTGIGGPCNDMNGLSIRVPDSAKWQGYNVGGTDGHMVVIEPDGTEFDFWQVTRKDPGGGVMTFSAGGHLSITGSGIFPTDQGGANAAGTGMLAGMIRPEEWVSGTINHPIYISLPHDNGSGAYPSSGHHGDEGGAGWPTMGTRFQLQITDSEIAAQPVWARPVLRAARDYGLVMEDTGSFAFWQQGGIQYDVYGYESPLTTYFRSLGLGWYAPDSAYVAHWRNLVGIDWTKMIVVDPCVSAHTC